MKFLFFIRFREFFATETISAGEFVVTYAGELLLPVTVADKKEDHTYIYYFHFGSLEYRQIAFVNV